MQDRQEGIPVSFTVEIKIGNSLGSGCLSAQGFPDGVRHTGKSPQADKCDALK